MPVPALASGFLPMGRWNTTPKEIYDAFVKGHSREAHRGAIFSEWLDLTQVLQDIVRPVPAAWLGGSFFTDKDEPGDIDCAYFVEEHLFTAVADVNDRDALAKIASNQVKPAFRVDSFVVPWAPTPGPTPGVGTQEYLWTRGFWDDLWVRQRSSDQRLESVPTRGYLEVILDGWS